MADAKPKRKITKPPSRKQLAARKKFVRMVKARAKAARAANRASRNVKHPTHSQAVRYAKRKAVATKRKGKGRAEKFVEALIPAPIMALNRGRKNSSGAGARRAEAFHGRPVRNWSTDKVSRHVPARTSGAGLGRLTRLKVRTGSGTKAINFGNRAKLVQVGPRHLAIANARFRRPPATNPQGFYNAGQVEETEYATDKPHLGHKGQTRFYHKHGEETGALPCLYIDDEGYAIIKGGKMRISPDGITD